MSFTPHGKHLVNGEWLAGESIFESTPAYGPAHRFFAASPALVERAAQAAEAAFWHYAHISRTQRADFLHAIADEIEARGSAITEIAMAETGLPAVRLDGERGRTTGQLRLFAEHIRDGAYLDRRVAPALPERKPAPRPEIRMMQRPVGPVAIFGASNFPLAFSTAGGDTAAALAAGCPVIVKGHSAHPGTAEIVAEAIHAALQRCELPGGVFALLQGGNRTVGESLVCHPLVKAVGFTGSLVGGRALFNLCAARPEPIPFFGELGSVNPMFVLPHALKARGQELGTAWAGSLTMGVGQFCTNPGIVIVPEGPEGDAFIAAALDALKHVPPQTMLTDGIATACHTGTERMAASSAVRTLLRVEGAGRQAGPALFETTLQAFLEHCDLGEEVFGPLGLVVRVEGDEDMLSFAHTLHGQLTLTLHLDEADHALAARLMPILERKAGRILANGFPTGVEVVDSMVHGGPYPASTNFGATSVGTLAIRRFLRPVAYQNLPAPLLPQDLRA